MFKKKSDSIAEQLKNAGNSKYMQKDFIEALKLYNEALCHAQSQEKMAIIYGNRSAVYFEIFKFKESLINIKKAKELGYPEDKIQKLNDREANCKKSLSKQLRNDQEVQEFLQLSHPPNPKIPFIVDCIELRYTKEFGRGIYATKDLSAGDIIAIETPIFPSIDDGGYYLCCNNCIKVNMMNLIPCSKTASFMFCSEKCRDEAYEKFPDLQALLPTNDDHSEDFSIWKCFFETEHAFGGRDKLKKFLRENTTNKWKKTVFDYDFTDQAEYDKNLILSAMSLVTNYNSEYVHALEHCVKQHLSTGTRGKELESFLFHLLKAFFKNNSSPLFFNSRYKASLLNVFGSLFNHSCWPNIHQTYVEGKTITALTKSVKAGEQLLFNYVGSQSTYLPREQRQALINKSHYFTCHCYFCENNVTPDQLMHIDDTLSFKFLWDSIVIRSMDALEIDEECNNMKKLREVFDALRTRKIAVDDHCKETHDLEIMLKNCFKSICELVGMPFLNIGAKKKN